MRVRWGLILIVDDRLPFWVDHWREHIDKIELHDRYTPQWLSYTFVVRYFSFRRLRLLIFFLLPEDLGMLVFRFVEDVGLDWRFRYVSGQMI
jgi:uncharacterized protein YutD